MAAVAQARPTTMVVPLNDDSIFGYDSRETTRTKKSASRRPPTPKPTKSNKRVFNDIENERDITPKRARRQAAVKLDGAVQPLIEEDEPVLHLDDLLEAVLTPEGNFSAVGTASAGKHENATGQSVIISSPRPAQSSRRSRADSPFKFRKQGQALSVVPTKNSSPGQRRIQRRLLISDFAEPQPAFDSVIEGEDFSMVSLSSVPSAQLHLSQRNELMQPLPAVETSTRSEQPTPSSPSRSAMTTPTAAGRVGAFKGQYNGRRGLNPAVPSDDTLLLTPFRERAAASSVVPSRQITVAKTSEIQPHFDKPQDISTQQEAIRSNQEQHKNGDEYLSGQDLDYQEAPASPRYPEIPHNDQHLSPNYGYQSSDHESIEPNDVLDDIGEEGDFINGAGFGSEDESVFNNNLPDQSQHEPNEPELFIRAHQAEEQQVHNITETYDASSLLQLPQKGPTPSKVYSSPQLPNIPGPRAQASKPLPKAKMPTPKLKRVVNAGKALQGAVEPSFSGESSLRNSVEPAKGNLFSGFSVASRRELRAGLRLGEELAKRQSSILDVTMDSVHSRAAPSASAQPSTPPARSTALRDTAEIPAEVSFPSIEVGRGIRRSDSGLHRATSNTKAAPSQQQFTSTDASMMAKRRSHIFQRSSSQQIQDEDEDGEVKPDHSQHSDYEPDDAFEQNQELELELEPEQHEATDVWQLEAESTRNLRSTMTSHHVPNQASSSPSQQIEQPQAKSFLYEEEMDDEELDRDVPEVHDFDEEEAAMSSRINTPAKMSGMFTPSDSASSPVTKGQRKNVEITDFTGFTQDLLQAARQQPVRHAPKEAKTDQTPVYIHRKPDADEFTTRSLLNTSIASYRSPQRLSVRKPISFRPVNRKESWLLDPARARKPISPPKRAEWLPPPVTPSDSASTSPDIEDAVIEEEDIPEAEEPVANEMNTRARIAEQRDEQADSASTEEVQSTPSPRPIDSSPLSIFVAAQQKRAAEQTKIQAEAPVAKSAANPVKQVEFKPEPRPQPRTRPVKQVDFVDSESKHQPTRYLRPVYNVNKPTTNPRISKVKPLPSASAFKEPQAQFEVLQPKSIVAANRDASQQSFTSPSANTSYSEDDTQFTWRSVLTSVATPFINSTKAISSLASAAFQQTQHQTFFPPSAPRSMKPAVLTTHLPFNDAHWTALRELHTAALQQPKKFPLNLRSHSADYLGLEVESLGWKRELKEWELAVVERFLLLLDKEGIEQGSDQDPIDAEDVIKRVFSLWVGMITRGELDLTEGKAGAWDRRFVGRRDEVLQKQKVWMSRHGTGMEQ